MSSPIFFHHILPTGLRVVTQPTSEPVTLAEAKLWIRQETDFTTDDDLIGGLITAARVYAETYQKRTLISTTYEYAIDYFPLSGIQWAPIGGVIPLPMPRLQSVSSITYVAQDGNVTTLDSSKYVVDTVSQPGRIATAYAQPWPVIRPTVGAVKVTYVAGYTSAANVPETTKTAIKLLVGHWYRNREAVGNVGGEVAFAVKALLDVDSVGGLY